MTVAAALSAGVTQIPTRLLFSFALLSLRLREPLCLTIQNKYTSNLNTISGFKVLQLLFSFALLVASYKKQFVWKFRLQLKFWVLYPSVWQYCLLGVAICREHRLEPPQALCTAATGSRCTRHLIKNIVKGTESSVFLPKKLVFTRPSALEDLGAAIIQKSHDKKNSAKGTTDLRVAVGRQLSPIWFQGLGPSRILQL